MNKAGLTGMDNNKKESLKVLIITHDYKHKIGGGVGRVINGFMPWLAEKTEVVVFQLQWNRWIFGWTVYYYVRNRLGERVKKYLRRNSLPLLRRLLCRGNYNIVHFIHNSPQTAECIELIKKHFPSMKIIYSCHNIAKYEKEIRHSSGAHLASESCIFHNINHLHLLNKTSGFYLKQSYPELSGSQKVSFIPNGIDEKDFHKQDIRWKKNIEAMLKGNEIKIVCLSRWSYGKGLEYLLMAVPYLAACSDNFKIILAGRKKRSWENGVGGYVAMINDRLSAVKDYVIDLDWLDDGRRNALLSMADIWVMPSHLEYFPYSVLEPMINKIPIVSARIDAVTELLEEEKDCLFYEPADAVQLSEKIIYLIENPAVRRQLAMNSYEKASRLLKWETISRQYLKMYHSVLCH